MSPEHPPGAAPVTRRPLIIAGMPRSGTTWTKQVLECDPSLHSLMEPDSEGHRASAIWAKRHAGRFPALVPGEPGGRYHRLWAWILEGAHESLRLRSAEQVLRIVRPPERNSFLSGNTSPRMSLAATLGAHPSPRRSPALADHRLLVKTVHAPLAIDWLASEFDVDVVMVLRHPGSVLASWISLDYVDQYVPFEGLPGVQRVAEELGVAPPGPDHLTRMIWRIGVLLCSLERAADRHPDWVVRTHEQLCRDPQEEFRQLYADLGLRWNEDAERNLVENDEPGRRFLTKRVAAELPDNWKQRLTPSQITELRRVLEPFPLTRWKSDDFRLAPDA
jgi:hypothetical protein